MARYIDADELEYAILHLDIDVAEPKCKDYESYINGANQFRHQVKVALRHIPTADVVEVKHGEWQLEIKSFYADNWDESIELIVYILATCPYCGEAHNPKQVFSKSLYPPEDANEDFRFNQAYEKQKALTEFRQKNYKFQNYCPNCRVKMKNTFYTELSANDNTFYNE